MPCTLERSSDGVNGRGAVLHDQLAFGGRTHQPVIAIVKIEKIGRGVHGPQGAIDIELIAPEALLEPSAQHDLEHIAPKAAFDALFDHGQIVVVGDVARLFADRGKGEARHVPAPDEAFYDVGLAFQPLHLVFAQIEFVAVVIDHHHILIQPIAHQCNALGIFRYGGGLVEKPDGVIAGIAEQPLCKPDGGGIVGFGREAFEAVHKGTEHLRNIGTCVQRDFFGIGQGQFLLAKALCRNLGARNGVDADDAVAVFGHMVVGTFQEDGVPESIAQPQVDAYRREHIRQHRFYRSGYHYLFHDLQPVKVQKTGKGAAAFPKVKTKKPRQWCRGFPKRAINSMERFGIPLIKEQTLPPTAQTAYRFQHVANMRKVRFWRGFLFPGQCPRPTDGPIGPPLYILPRCLPPFRPRSGNGVAPSDGSCRQGFPGCPRETRDRRPEKADGLRRIVR